MAKRKEQPAEDKTVMAFPAVEIPDGAFVNIDTDALRKALSRFVNNPGWHTNIYEAQELTIALPLDELEDFRRLVNG